MIDANSNNLSDDPALHRQWTKVERKLNAAKKHLAVAGNVFERRLPGLPSVWVVRYYDRQDGKRRYRSIYLGEEAIAEYARALIGQWRRDRITPEERRHKETLALLDISASATGFSRRARKRLQSATEAARGDQRAMLHLVYSHPDHAVQFGRPGGRPSKASLW